MRAGQYNEETGKMVLTVSEYAGCSGFPLLGDRV